MNWTRVSLVRMQHIFVAFVDAQEEAAFSGDVDGLAGPTFVLPSTGAIVQGQVILRTDYFASIQSRSGIARTMDLHEIGHALGLAHSTGTADVMFSRVTTQNVPTDHDVTSVRRLVHPCSTTTTGDAPGQA